MDSTINPTMDEKAEDIHQEKLAEDPLVCERRYHSPVMLLAY